MEDPLALPPDLPPVILVEFGGVVVSWGEVSWVRLEMLSTWTSVAVVVVDERLEEGGGNSFPFIYRGGNGDLETSTYAKLHSVAPSLAWPVQPASAAALSEEQ